MVYFLSLFFFAQTNESLQNTEQNQERDVYVESDGHTLRSRLHLPPGEREREYTVRSQ